MKKLKSYNNERGAALVISLMFIAILALLGVTGVVLTTTDMQIGSNYRQHSVAFYNASAGLQFAVGTIENDLKNETTVSNGTTEILPETIGASEPFTATPSGFSVTISDITMISDFPPIYSLTSTGHDSHNLASVKLLGRFKKDPFDPAFDVGILADQDIRINGGPYINGSLHSNGSAVQTGSGIIDGNVSAVGSLDVHAAVTGTETANADEIQVPLITSDDFNEWRAKAQSNQPPNIYQNSDCTYSESGDHNDKIVFVDGNIIVSGSALRNVTIVATGNIIINGASTMNADGTIGVAMIAGGDIEFNGSSHTYGAFWCNGDFINNGSSMLEGAIVAGGDVTRHGAFYFTHNNKLDNENLPPGKDCELITWENVRG